MRYPLKVEQLVDEIAAASQEQSQGIGQVNIAVTEMDKLTQQTAANAEESASAAEELNAQAEQMKGLWPIWRPWSAATIPANLRPRAVRTTAEDHRRGR